MASTVEWSCDQTNPDLQDFYIIPVANPDGYQYTWTYDRFWYYVFSSS